VTRRCLEWDVAIGYRSAEMDRATLLASDKLALVELVLQQQQVISGLSARVGEQETQLAAQQTRLAELEAQLAKPAAPAKTPENSSVPPSQARKPNRAARRGKKRGPKRGHTGTSRPRAVPDAVVVCRPTACGGCGALLPPEGQRLIGRSQIEELPVVQTIVIEVLRYQATCANCGTRTVAEPPPWFAPQATFGPRVDALLAYLHETHHVSYERLVELCRDVLGLQLSEGAIANALGRVATRAGPAVERIREQVRTSAVINSDETGARVDGDNRCHWVFQTPTASYQVIAETKGAAVIAEFLGDQRPAVWGSDAAPAQLGAAAAQHQLCLAHQLRDLTYAAEADDPPGRAWARQLRHVLGRALRLHRERQRLSTASFAQRRTRVIRAADRLIFGPPLGSGAAWQLQQRYRKHWATLFVFLERESACPERSEWVEPTNNSSERDLRPTVMHRKMTGGYRSEAGAQRGGIFATVLATARKNRQNRFETLCQITGVSPLGAAHQAT
jgi:transposase